MFLDAYYSSLVTVALCSGGLTNINPPKHSHTRIPLDNDDDYNDESFLRFWPAFCESVRISSWIYRS